MKENAYVIKLEGRKGIQERSWLRHHNPECLLEDEMRNIRHKNNNDYSFTFLLVHHSTPLLCAGCTSPLLIFLDQVSFLWADSFEEAFLYSMKKKTASSNAYRTYDSEFYVNWQRKRKSLDELYVAWPQRKRLKISVCPTSTNICVTFGFASFEDLWRESSANKELVTRTSRIKNPTQLTVKHLEPPTTLNDKKESYSTMFETKSYPSIITPYISLHIT